MDVAERYRQWRASRPDMPAMAALAWARASVRQHEIEQDWDVRTLAADGVVDGFEVRVDVFGDADPDLSWLGQEVRKGTPGAVRVRTATRGVGWVVPTRHADDERRDLHKRGYSRHDAHTMARALLRADARLLLEADVCVIRAIAYHDGAEMGRAYLSGCLHEGMAGIDGYLAAAFEQGVVDQAVTEARKALDKANDGRFRGMVMDLSVTEAEALVEALRSGWSWPMKTNDGADLLVRPRDEKENA